MIKLIKQSLGNGRVALGVRGSNQADIEATLTSLYNGGAIEPAGFKPGYMPSGASIEYPLGMNLGAPSVFQYALTTAEKLWDWARYCASLRFDCERVSTPSLEHYLDSKASETLAAIESETFLHYGKRYFLPVDDMLTSERCRQAKLEIAELREHPERESART